MDCSRPSAKKPSLPTVNEPLLQMPSTVRDLILVLETYFEPETSLRTVWFAVLVIWSLAPILRMHHLQNMARRVRESAWTRCLLPILVQIFSIDGDSMLTEEEIYGLYRDLPQLTDLLDSEAAMVIPEAPISLCTSRTECIFCRSHYNEQATLRRTKSPRIVKIVSEKLTISTGFMYPAHCPRCLANYFPDCYTLRNPDNQQRQQYMEFDAKYLSVSKHGVYAARRVAVMQEHAVFRLHAGWSAFAMWIKDQSPTQEEVLTVRQSQRLYVEHLGRKLLRLHDKTTIGLPPHANTQELAGAIRDILGQGGGRIEAAIQHGCAECTHHKRYRADLLRENVRLPNNAEDRVADVHELVGHLLSVA